MLRIVGHSDPQLRALKTCVIYVHTHLIDSSMSCELFTRHLWHHLHYPLLRKGKSSLLLPMKITHHHHYYLSLFEWNVFATSAILFLCCIFDRLFKAVLGPEHGPKKKPGHIPFGLCVAYLTGYTRLYLGQPMGLKKSLGTHHLAM